jgi:holliday junction DNA helicase RuvA
MISYVKGTILHKTNSYVILENVGIGYKIFVAPSLLEPPLGAVLELFTYHKSSDDGQALFGFSNAYCFRRGT